jgi:CelD/BcsL family acetyltransferase involved in cellulose biosynthesis
LQQEINMPEVIEIRDIEDLDAYCFQWKSLFSQTRSASIFQTYDWLKAYWKHFGEDQQLRVLIVSSRGSIIETGIYSIFAGSTIPRLIMIEVR